MVEPRNPEERLLEARIALQKRLAGWIALRELDQRGRGAGAEIAQFTASYAEVRREVSIANSEGLFTGDDRTRVRIGAQAVARRDGTVETGAETLGAHRGFELFDNDPGSIADVNYGPSGATPNEIAIGNDARANEGLIVAGGRYTVSGPGGSAPARRATEFWTRFAP